MPPEFPAVASLGVPAPDAPQPAAPRPAPQELCGFLVLDKPAGLTSHGCVAQVRRAYGLKRVGHGGTLDPAVTGVLPIALGGATRLLPYLTGDKRYRGVIRLGLRTSSDDLSGDLLEERPVPPLGLGEIEAALAPFRGTIQQRPPNVSAVHVEGERAYQRARRGEALNLASKTVTISELTLLGWDGERAELELEVACSAGTYIRSLARDLGEALGWGGCLASLRRTEALGFGLDQSVPLDRLQQAPPPDLLDPLVVLGHLGRRQLEGESELTSWRCGRSLEGSPALADGSAVVVVGPDGSLAGMAQARADGRLQPKLVLQANG
jgi:tRNA pseudouridine55 synthase